MKKPTERIYKLSQYVEKTVLTKSPSAFAIHTYRKDLQKLVHNLIPSWASVIEFGSRSGDILNSLPNPSKIGIEVSKGVIQQAQKKYKNIQFIQGDYEHIRVSKKIDYVILTNILSFLYDTQPFIDNIRHFTYPDSRIIVISFNFLWKPLLDVAADLNLRTQAPFEVNWLSSYDIQNLFYLEGYELVKKQSRMLLPVEIPILSWVINTFLAKLPGFQSLCLTQVLVFKPLPKPKEYSVSIIIPARNEEGNIPKLLDRIPRMGTSTEVIFVEGHSKDNTYQSIQEELRRYKGHMKAYLYKQTGIGKRNAVEYALKKVNNELVIILDADLTVDPSELPKFYNAIAQGKGDLIIGSRLIYPMEKQAMRFLNYLGNKFFSMAFTFLVGQTIKDTLCGTKAFLLSTYKDIERNREQFGDFDPFGDFDLIFGASKLNLKITEIPTRYKERSYGTSNISRFTHGILLFKMTLIAAKKIKFI